MRSTFLPIVATEKAHVGGAQPRRVWLHSQRDQFGVDCSIFYYQPSNADWQLETPWSRAARVEIDHAVFSFVLRDVAVSVDYSFESRCLRLQVQLGEIVQNVNRNGSDFHDFGHRQSTRPPSAVDVAADGGDRRNGRKLIKDFRRADITCMNDLLGIPQSFDCFRPKQSVRVGDDSDEN